MSHTLSFLSIYEQYWIGMTRYGTGMSSSGQVWPGSGQVWALDRYDQVWAVWDRYIPVPYCSYLSHTCLILLYTLLIMIQLTITMKLCMVKRMPWYSYISYNVTNNSLVSLKSLNSCAFLKYCLVRYCPVSYNRKFSSHRSRYTFIAELITSLENNLITLIIK